MNIRTKPVLVHNKTTKLAVLFVLVGAMMIVVPMLTEQVYARTSGSAQSTSFDNNNAVFTNVKAHLDAGRWVIFPRLIWDGHAIEWVSAGPLPFGGNEKGQVDADVVLTLRPDQPIGHVTLFWTNPLRGPNTCNVQSSGQVGVVCHISQGDSASASYISTVKRNSNPNGGSCITGTEHKDNLIGTSNNDCIDGKGGNDKITGLAGNDKLNGGDGKDLLSGGNGNDELTGGIGADSFQCGSGNDKITDFKPSEGDKKTNDCEQY